MNGIALPGLAVAAGLLSAISPCVLPVIPGYLAAVSTTADGHGAAAQWQPSRRGALGFVAGFTAVFTLLGATASFVGSLVFDHLGILLNVAGVGLIVLGAATSGLLDLPMLGRERRAFDLARVAGGPRRAMLLGVAFALGWTPCIGPVLAVILTKAAADATIWQGIILLLMYSVGLAIPFLAIAWWFDRTRRLRALLSRHARMLQRVAGAIMIAAGIGYLTGTWTLVFANIQRRLARLGWPPI